MRTTKKLLNLFLVLCLILSCAPLSVSADETVAESDWEINRSEALSASETAGESTSADLSVPDTKPIVSRETEPYTAHDENSAAESGETPVKEYDEGVNEEAFVNESEEDVSETASEPYEGAPENTETRIGTAMPDDEALSADNETVSGSSVTETVFYQKYGWDGTKVVSSVEAAYNVESVPADGRMTSGWYYLNNHVTKDGRIESITGDVNLILGDGYELDVKGLYVPPGHTLTIYAQSVGKKAGTIYSHPGKNQGGAGIGGWSLHDNGQIVIHGGNIRADGYDNCAGIGSNDGRTGSDITIYGGTVTANGGSRGAGIGGGRNCDVGNITIYGGTVTANGGSQGAGIGGGQNRNGGTIAIYGGEITAKGGGTNGAGIGGGESGSGGTITIHGGTVNANDEKCNENGAGIGGGDSADGGEITINDGTVTVYSRDGAGIGGGDDGDGGTITINGGTITANKVNQGQGARIGGGCDADGGTVTINGGSITAEGGKGASIGGGKGCKGGTVNINGGVIRAAGSSCIGKGEEGSDVTVVLNYTDNTKDTISITASSYGGTVTLNKPFVKYAESDGQTLKNTFTEGVVPDNDLLADGVLKAWDKVTPGNVIEYTEYRWNEEAQSLETNTVTTSGFVELTSDMQELAGGTYVVRKNMTVDHYLSVQKGATVNLIVPQGVVLTCTEGIGSGYNKAGEYATLNIFGEGSIVVNGMENAAGIGGDDEEASGNITFHGITVIATGGKHGAGIGGGEGGKDPDGKTSIKIYAGTITATGGVDGAGIGGGDGQPGAHTYIYSGTITAESKKHGAGIGGGDGEGTLGIFIYDGKVTATGGNHGAGIGAGEEGGNLRKAGNGGGVNIYGGDVTAEGGSGAAGIGGGFDEDMSGTVNIYGYDTRLTATGGTSGAGIGAGSGDWGTDGDMNGTITIDCGSASDIKTTGGGKHNQCGGAGIGAGYEGNMEGTFYYKGGNVDVTAGGRAAGIGGGDESLNCGGEGGTAYIGGDNLHVISDTEDASAIGKGGSDLSNGTVYIAADNNGTGKYLRVDYCDYDLEFWSTVKASKRSSTCHKETHIQVTECNHKDVNGKSGLTYKIKGDKHKKKCKYCGLDVKEDHIGADCVCGYRSDTCTVTISDETGLTADTVARGKEFELPDFSGQVMSGNLVPRNFYRVKGWMLEGDTSGRIYDQGESIPVNGDMTFVSAREHLYQINFEEAANGRIKADFDESGTCETYAAEGETLSFDVAADPGYSVGNVTYKIMEGYEIDSKGDVIYNYSEPVEITPSNGKYQLTMPELTSVDHVDYNRIIVAAEITKDSEHTVIIPEDLTGGTVTADQATAAEGTTITLTVTSNPNYHLELLRCRKAGGEDVELTQVGETGQYTFVMPAEDVWVKAEWEAALPVAIKGVTGSFNDKIKLNYYLDIPEEVMADQNAYVKITNERTGKGLTLSVQSAPFNREKGGYKFSIPLAAKEASDTITAKIFDCDDRAITLIGERSGKDYTESGVPYSMMQYYDWLEKNGGDDNERAVGAAARDYCIAAQIYFEYYKDGLAVSSAVDAVTKNTLADYVSGRSGSLPPGVSINGITAMLESDNTLRLYYGFEDVRPEDYTFKIDEKEVEIRQRPSDKKYYIALDAGVYSNHLQDEHTYSISDGENTYEITASVLTFARSCLLKSDVNEINLGKALYLYNRAAVAAFGK